MEYTVKLMINHRRMVDYTEFFNSVGSDAHIVSTEDSMFEVTMSPDTFVLFVQFAITNIKSSFSLRSMQFELIVGKYEAKIEEENAEVEEDELLKIFEEAGFKVIQVDSRNEVNSVDDLIKELSGTSNENESSSDDQHEQKVMATTLLMYYEQRQNIKPKDAWDFLTANNGVVKWPYFIPRQEYRDVPYDTLWLMAQRTFEVLMRGV